MANETVANYLLLFEYSLWLCNLLLLASLSILLIFCLHATYSHAAPFAAACLRTRILGFSRHLALLRQCC